MSEVFGPAHAAAHDIFYAAKDYAAECDVIERAFAEFSTETVRRVLDLGCGTGGHAIQLASRGYDVLGVDRSPGMLVAARAKAEAAAVPGRIAFVQGDITEVPIGAPHDSALMMFAVLGYQGSPAEMAATLGAVRRSLRIGGLFLFDVWHAAGVERDPPAQRWRMAEQDGARLIRLSSGQLNREGEFCDVTIRLLRLAGDGIVNESVEHHRLRYFRRETLVAALDDAGMELVRLGSFPQYWHEPNPHNWSVLGVARVIR